MESLSFCGVEIPLDFSGETSPIRRRNMPEFSAYFNLVWKELKI